MDDFSPRDIGTDDQPYEGSVKGQFLIASPAMSDPRFKGAVIYMCVHNDQGAMGLIINRAMPRLTFGGLLQQVGIQLDRPVPEFPIQQGGPVETTRGFVLHSTDVVRADSMKVTSEIALTNTIDILRVIAEGRGPAQCLCALGYAGWGPGQLEEELSRAGWLTAPAVPEIVFDPDFDGKWLKAMKAMGIDPSFLSSEIGYA